MDKTWNGIKLTEFETYNVDFRLPYVFRIIKIFFVNLFEKLFLFVFIDQIKCLRHNFKDIQGVCLML